MSKDKGYKTITPNLPKKQSDGGKWGTPVPDKENQTSKTKIISGGRQYGKSFEAFNQFLASAKTGKSVKYVGRDWIAMDMKTYKAERTQLLTEVREKVIGYKCGKHLELLKKLKELEEVK